MKVNMCGTLEYMSPEVMNCQFPSFASGLLLPLVPYNSYQYNNTLFSTYFIHFPDMWGVGAITYLLVSGGVSPFWTRSRYRTMARTLSCDYNFDQPNFSLISDSAKDFISKLLLLDPKDRLSPSLALSHPWLTHIGLQSGLSEKEHWRTLETAWMKGILARRRWQRWFHAITAMHRIRKLSVSHV